MPRSTWRLTRHHLWLWMRCWSRRASSRWWWSCDPVQPDTMMMDWDWSSKKNFNTRAGADTGRRGSEIRTWNHISHFLLEFVTHKHSTLYSLLFCIIYTEWYTISPFTTDNNTTHSNGWKEEVNQNNLVPNSIHSQKSKKKVKLAEVKWVEKLKAPEHSSTEKLLFVDLQILTSLSLSLASTSISANDFRRFQLKFPVEFPPEKNNNSQKSEFSVSRWCWKWNVERN